MFCFFDHHIQTNRLKLKKTAQSSTETHLLGAQKLTVSIDGDSQDED